MSKSLLSLISLAKSEEGYIEKASKANLDSKTANRGTANYTKYSRDIDNWGLSGCQGQPWCCSLQFWLDASVFGVDTALKLWNMSKSTYVGYNCFSTYNVFKAAKKVGMTPKLGAVIIFTFSHAGRVIDIYSRNGVKYISCMEGNTSSNINDRNGGQVKIKERLANDPTIKAYCYIDYDQFETANYSSTPISTSKKGLCITASSLNIRSTPNGDLTKKTYKKDTYIQVKAKSFVENAPWFQVSDGNWVSAKYLTGWVKESDERWWYLLDGYKWHKNTIQIIDGKSFIFDNDGFMITGWFKNIDKWMYADPDGVVVKGNWIKHTDNNYYYLNADGYMVTNSYIKSKDKDLYYWVNDKGVWEEQWNTSFPNLNKYKLVE